MKFNQLTDGKAFDTRNIDQNQYVAFFSILERMALP